MTLEFEDDDMTRWPHQATNKQSVQSKRQSDYNLEFQHSLTTSQYTTILPGAGIIVTLNKCNIGINLINNALMVTQF